MSKSYTCLYTKHKTQKRKKWNDGKLTVHRSGLIHLYGSTGTTIITSNNTNMTLDTLAITIDQVQLIFKGNITELEMDKHLIEIEGEWNNNTSSSSSGSGSGSTTTIAATTSTSSMDGGNRLLKRKNTNGMQKILNNKFKKPAKYIPQPTNNANSNANSNSSANAMNQRKRPLQPGEYMRQFHGNGHINNNNNGNNNNGYNNNGLGNQNRHSNHHGHHMDNPYGQHGQHQRNHGVANGNGIGNGNGNGSTMANSQVTHSNHGHGHGRQPGNPYCTMGAPAPAPFTTTDTTLYQQRQQQLTGSGPNTNISSSAVSSRGTCPSSANTTSTRRHQFVSNDFDPNSFYDEEEDEDEQDHEHGNGNGDGEEGEGGDNASFGQIGAWGNPGNDNDNFNVNGKRAQDHSHREGNLLLNQDKDQAPALEKNSMDGAGARQNGPSSSMTGTSSCQWNGVTTTASEQDQNGHMTNSDLLELFNVGNNDDVGGDEEGGHGHGNAQHAQQTDQSHVDDMYEGDEGDEPPKAPNSFLNRLLRSEQELDHNSKLGSALDCNGRGNDVSFYKDNDENSHSDDSDDAGDLPWGDMNDDNCEDVQTEVNASALHTNNEGVSKGDDPPDGCGRNNDAPTVSFDINVADFDSESSDEDG